MNIKNNLRSRETDERIIRTVYQKMVDEHKPLSRITVREICEEAQINRSTFYAHYQDVYDVVERVEKQMSEDLTRRTLETVESASSISDVFVEIFRYVGDYREFYTFYFSEMHTSGVIDLAWELIGDRASTLSYKDLGYKSQKELEYHGEFFISGFTALLRRWLATGCEETPQEMMEILARQYNPNRSMFEWGK